MPFAVGAPIRNCGVGATNEHREVAAFFPCARTNGVAGPALDGQIAGFQIEKQGLIRFERPEQRGFSNTAFAEDHRLDATAFGKALVGENEGEVHQRPPSLSNSKVSLPERTVRAGSKIRVMCVGQAVYFRSETRKLTST